MARLNGFDYFETQFTKDGQVFDRSQFDQLLAASDTYSDVFVIAHGWNNDDADARDLYNRLSKEIAAAFPRFPFGDRTFAVLGIFWPSKKFADAELIPGGGASAQPDAVLAAKVMRLKEAVTANAPSAPTDPNDAAAAVALSDAAKQIPSLDQSSDARTAFVVALRTAVSGLNPTDQKDDASDRLFSLSPDDLLKRLANADDDFWDEDPPKGSPAASLNAANFQPFKAGGGAAGLGGIITSFKDGARSALNLFTYFVMKERAGVVGKNGAAQLLGELAAKKPAIRLHLIGHSFGGRLVTAATAAVPKPVQTLTLLQAAYSHNGLSPNFDGKGTKGFFNAVLANKKVAGPIVISHTRNDRAVGIAYPLASRLNGDVASGLGDANDPHGGMGSNGAQKSNADTSIPLTAGATSFPLAAGKIFNMNADAVITGHSDITKPEVASAILSAVGTS